VDVLAAYADRRIDISADGLIEEAPEAIEAILDLHYPDGRHRGDLLVARWRLQLLAELNVGSLARQDIAEEDNKVTRLKRATNAG
jgi:hypothetical protein